MRGLIPKRAAICLGVCGNWPVAGLASQRDEETRWPLSILSLRSATDKTHTRSERQQDGSNVSCIWGGRSLCVSVLRIPRRYAGLLVIFERGPKRRQW